MKELTKKSSKFKIFADGTLNMGVVVVIPTIAIYLDRNFQCGRIFCISFAWFNGSIGFAFGISNYSKLRTMEGIVCNNDWLYSLDYAAWCIAFEERDPKEQQVQIIALVKKYAPNAK